MTKCSLDIKYDLIDGISKQAVSSGAFTKVDQELLRIADPKKSASVMRDINNKFGEQVLQSVSTDREGVIITPSGRLVEKYYQAYQQQQKNKILRDAQDLQDEERARGGYDESARGEFYQLTSKETEEANQELDSYLLNFLKPFGVRSKEFDSLKERLGMDALGATDTLNKLIWYSKNRKVDTLPEEAAHMIVMLMGETHPDVRSLMTEIKLWSGYKEVYDEYMPKYNNEKQVKIEALGKLLSQAMVKNYKASGFDQSLLEKVLRVIKDFFNKLDSYMASPSEAYFTSEYLADKIAVNILSGNKNYIADISKAKEQLDYQKALEQNPHAQRIIDTFTAGKFNFKLVGSLAIAGQGEKIYRPTKDPIHDLDFVVENIEDYNDLVNYLDQTEAVPVHNGWKHENYVTYAYYIPAPGYSVKVTSRKKSGWAETIQVIDKSTGKTVPATSQNVIATDFFVYYTPSKERSNGVFKSWQDIYFGKLALSPLQDSERLFQRDKDQMDYVLAKPNDLSVSRPEFVYLQKEQQSARPSNAEIDKKILNFLASIGVNVKTVETLHDKDGKPLDAVAKAMMLNKIIEIVEGKADITTLSEEAAHFFVEMLGENSPIYKSMFDKITGYKIYQETVAQYKDLKMYRNADGTVNFTKIKKEAMGKLIMAHIVKQETGEEASEKINTVKTFWTALWELIKDIFGQSTSNPFAEVASQILGNDISNLDTQKQLEDEEYLQAGPTLFGIDKLLKDQDRIKLDDDIDPATGEKKHIYTVDTKPVVDKEGKSRSVNSVYVDAWYKQRFPTDNRSDRQKAIDNLKAEEGTKLHEDMQDIINRYFNKDGTKRDTPVDTRKITTNKEVYDKLEVYMLQLMEQYTDPGVRFLSEVRIYDPEKNVAGTIDLVIVKPDGSVDIYDWKSQEIGKDQDELKWFKAPAYRIQMEEYKKILSKHYGFSKFGKIRAIPIKTTYFLTKDANGLTPKSLKDIEMGHADSTKISKDKNYLLPVVMLYESTGDDNLDELIKKLNTIYDRLSEQKVGASEKDIKNEELNDLAKTIRDLQVRKDITSFIDNGIFEMRKYNKKLSDNSIDIFNIQDAIQTMKVYAEAQDFLATEMARLGMQVRKSTDPDEKKFLEETMDKFLEMQGNARVVLNKLIKRRDVLGDEFARGEGVNTLLNTEKSMDYLKRNFRSLSTLDTAALKTFYRALRRAQAVRDVKVRQMFDEMETAQKELMEWATKKGKSGADVYTYMLEMDSKGNWNGDFLNIYSKEYFTEKDKAIKANNLKWIKDNTDFDQAAYDQKRKEQMTMLEERYPGDTPEVKNKRDVLLIKWEEKYSDKYDFAYLNKYNTFIRPKAIWHSDKYKFMHEQGNEPLLNTYNYFQKMIRYSAELGMIDKFSSKFIPSVMKGVELDPKAIIDSMQVESDQGFGKIDNLTGQLKKEMPVYFTRDLGKTREDGSVDYSNKSQDLFKVFATWGNQMYNYEAMQSLEDISDALLEIERSKGSFVQNMFGRVDKTKVSKNNDINTKVLENFINYYLYGQNTMQGIDKAVKINGKEYSAVKGAQKLLKFMAVKTLGLNYLSGTATFVGGTANAWFQGSKRLIFTEGEWVRGMKDYSSKDEVTIAAIYQLGLSLEDHTNAKLRKLSVSGVMKHANSDALMFIQRGGDRWATMPVAAAMLHTYMIDENNKLVNIRQHVKDKNNYAGFYNLSKAEQSALAKKIDQEVEELQKTKSIKAMAKVVDDKLVLPGLTDNDENQAAFRGIVQKNLKQMIGNATRDDINQIRMTLLGQTLMQFRSWMPQLMVEHFGDMTQDADTDMWNYGKARLFMRHIFRKGALPLIKELITGFGPNTIELAKKRYAEFVGRLQEEGKINDPSEFMTEAEFIDMYIGNLRSMMRELMLLLSFGMLVFWSAGDDDDDKTGVQKFVHKAFKKYYNEFAFYYSPGEFTSMLKSPVPILGLLGDTERFLEDSMGQTWGFMRDDDDRMDRNRPIKYLNKILPIAKELQSTYAMFDDDFRREFDVR